MDDTGSNIFLIAYISSNIVALIMLAAAIKYPRIARLMFFLLFAWACWANWSTALSTPQFYLDYARAAFLDAYKSFINGWFSRHIPLAVGFIATCQALIAVSVLLKGPVYKTGVAGGIIFLLSILPLGLYSAFPCTLIMSIAMYLLFKYSQNYIWVYTPKAQDDLIAVD